jgi:asparagine synthase (glutamine-hydrolysing)
MCGIIGFSSNKNKKYLNVGLDSISHRGFDDRGKYVDKDFCLGMNRLAILDLVQGLYPIQYKHFVLVYNGEIYNYQYLRKKLENRKIIFYTKTDAEIILPLFDIYGEKALSMLEGMFSICIYDAKNKVLFLSRDKFGEKPLYYSFQNNIFAFASEIKALLALPFIQKNINRNTISEYLSQGYVGGKNTLVENIYKLKPSEYLTYYLNKRKYTVKNYWKIKIEDKQTYGSLDGAVAKADYLIKASVEKRLIADVPVGCFLSGGIDSSLITYYASQINPQINTFSVSFPYSFRYDESFFAKYIAKHLGTKHHEIICSKKMVKEVINNIGKYIDEPVSDPAFIPTLIMSNEARKKVKVVLTGEGADELFAGYHRYLRQMLVEYASNSDILKILLKIFQKTLFPKRFKNLFYPLSIRYHTQQIWTDEEIRNLFPNIKIKKGINGIINNFNNKLTVMQLADVRGYLAEQLLMKVDKSTMANNLESRAPYLDSEIVNFAFSLPDNYKIHNFQSKHIIRKLAQKYYPAWFAYRPKHGFSLPLGNWFRNELKKEIIMSIIDIKKYAPSIDINIYKKVIDDHMEGKTDNTDKIWSVFVLGSWLNYHKLIL